MNKEILNMDEAAELFNVSIKTFIKLLKEEKVPARKIGREWRFSKQALIQWLSSGDSQQYSSSDSDAAKDFFDKIAPEWEIMRSDYFDEDVISKLLDAKLLKKDMTLIDLGAGDGYLSRAVSPHVDAVIAIDISGAMLKELSKKAEKQGLKNIRTIISDGCDTPLADQSADIVCANMFLHHIEEPIEAVSEMYRVLKPGGRVFIADLKEHSNREFKEKMHDFWQGFSQKEVKEWFEKCGFKSVQFDSFSAEGSRLKAGDIKNSGRKGAGQKVAGQKTSEKKAAEGVFVMIGDK